MERTDLVSGSSRLPGRPGALIMSPRSPIKLNGVVLPPQMIAAEAQHHPAATPADAFAAAARAIIVRTLLLEEANRRRVVPQAEFVAPGKRELDDEARIRALMEAAVPVPEVGENECWTYYAANTTRFRAADLFEASHILFAAHPHDTAAFKTALERAKSTIAELTQAPMRFEAIAREKSDCDSRANGGRLGHILRGELVSEFERVLYALDEGQIAPSPVKTRFGAHIVKLDARALGEILPFEYVHDQIATFLSERSWRQDVARFIEGLVATASIEGVAMIAETEVA
ncbi:MAG: peptidyl-prolyl cis-trans isomerase [Proteobacteria bacterium]|nr:peptidyl-prolyl cis-trans isomerase [Pseudomonadota bacterium]